MDRMLNRMKRNDVTKCLSHWWHSFKVLIECNFCIIVCCIFMNESAFRVSNFYGLKSISLSCVGVFSFFRFLNCVPFVLNVIYYWNCLYWPLMHTAHFQRKTYSIHVFNVIHWYIFICSVYLSLMHFVVWLTILTVSYLTSLKWPIHTHSPTIRNSVWSAFHSLIQFLFNFGIFFYLLFPTFFRLFQIAFSFFFYLKQVRKLQTLEFASSKLLKITITIER